KFLNYTQTGDCSATTTGEYYRQGLVMDYYDGNTVTALWNYAQRYSMSDASYTTQFGPSTPGALNLISGQTHGATTTGTGTFNVDSNGTIFGDNDPTLDKCSTATNQVTMTGKYIGDLLNAKGITWGWFQGGFKPTGTAANGNPICGSVHSNI